MNELTFNNYESFKAELDKELMQEAQGFVKIGYLLRVAQDTNILSESGYLSVNDFAQAEYGLDKSQVSRFMAINERFSENGYSDRLESKYQNFGVAKLGIMLQLPDAVNDQLTPYMTKNEINAIKEEVKEEEKISDIEVMLEGKSERPLIWQILDNIMHEHPEIYKKVWEENDKAQRFNITTDTNDYAQDVLAPSGEALYTTRVSGVGKVMLTIKNESERLIITNIRTGEVTEPDWSDMGDCLRFKCAMESAESAYKERYGEDFPIIEEAKNPGKVTTTPKPKQEEKKETVKEPENRITTEYEADSQPKTAAGEENEKIAPVQQPENVINTECESHFEEDENTSQNEVENEPEKVEGEVETDSESKNDVSEEAKSRITTEYEENIRMTLELALDYCGAKAWESVRAQCNRVIELVNKIQEARFEE